MEITEKLYRCKRCGHEKKQSTNHYGPTWSLGHYHTCPDCPPWAKYPEFGGQTVWICMEKFKLNVDGELLSEGTRQEMDEKAATLEHMGWFGPDQIEIVPAA